MPLKHWQAWSIHHLSINPVAVFDHFLSKDVLPNVQSDAPRHNFEPFPRDLSLDSREKWFLPLHFPSSGNGCLCSSLVCSSCMPFKICWIQAVDPPHQTKHVTGGPMRPCVSYCSEKRKEERETWLEAGSHHLRSTNLKEAWKQLGS